MVCVNFNKLARRMQMCWYNWTVCPEQLIQKPIPMKKLITLFLAATVLASFASAATSFKGKRGLDKQLERIEAALGNTERDLSEQKRGFLERRAEVLELQLEVRAALKTAVSELGEDATEEELKAARQAVREQYKEQFQAMKAERRAEREERKAARETPAG